ncbi:MAG: hypothetical protein QM516_00675 [Limnohabitans sp.]|nr:hypothetical protein [Limnohabitans sp.]
MSDHRDHTIDAILSQHLGENGETMEARYARAFAALTPRGAAQESSRETQRALRLLPARGRQTSRLVSFARAALIALAFGALFLFFPTTTNASGILDRVLAAESRVQSSRGDRRYEIEVVLPPLPRRPDEGTRDRRNSNEIRAEIRLVGTWDLRGDESRLDLTAEGFPTVTRVDATEGAWERRGDGSVRALDERGIWPRWIRDPHGEIAVERMDGLLRLVQRSYLVALARAGDESPEHLRGAIHLVASRQGDVIGPTEIDLWIDTTRNVVLEARLAWQPPALRDRGMREGSRGAFREGTLGEFREGSRGAPPAPPPPLPPDDYRPSRGTLPPFPPRELFLRRIEPITFPANHFTMPSISGP